jgi:diguanylate cyclase
VCIMAAKSGIRREVAYRIRRGDGRLIQVRQVLEPLDSADGPRRWFNTIQDISEQIAQQELVARLSRMYAMLSEINSAIVRLRNRDELLQEACRVAVTHGGFSMAWAGVLDPATLDGKVVGWYGGRAGYVDKIQFTARAGGPGSERPACVAVRESRQVVCNDICAEPAMAALRAELLNRGHRSLAALPLIVDNRTVAVLSLFADQVDFFAQAEKLVLLDELAGDLSFGLQFIDKEERLNYLAYYDVLTGLSNSMLFNDRLAQFLHSARDKGDMVAVAIFNLDRFSHLNDALGRHAGDTVLTMVAERLRAKVCEPASLARIGGDTFAVAFGGLQRAADAAPLLEQQVLAPLSEAFALAQQEVRITLRAGIAVYPADGNDAETVFKHAEVALKKAKSGGAPYLYYAPAMNAVVAARLALESALNQALEQGQFAMYYQPRVDLLSGRIVGAEALIRWRHPERGIVGPAEFIALAEETGQIVAIGDWVLDAVCAQQALWKAAHVATVPVAINLSAIQLAKENLQVSIRSAVKRHGVGYGDIEFELTESAVMDDPADAGNKLHALKALGLRLSLDDFGTGYSSLAYLKRFPFDFIKIDRAFVTDITKDPDDAAIANAIIAMAHGLGLRVVAEGVETEGQLQFLRRRRCDELQGYFFSKPVPAGDFETMLREDRRLALAPEPAQREDTLLIVDDEPSTLAALRRQLRRQGYRVLTAESGREGLELLAVNSVQVVLADQRMPEMSGSKFLGLVKDLYPDTVRIILSGYTDLQAVTDSVNRGAVYKFLSKPWDDDELEECLRDAFRRYHASR